MIVSLIEALLAVFGLGFLFTAAFLALNRRLPQDLSAIIVASLIALVAGVWLVLTRVMAAHKATG